MKRFASHLEEDITGKRPNIVPINTIISNKVAANSLRSYYMFIDLLCGERCEAAPISPSDFFLFYMCLHRLSLFIFVQHHDFILCLVNIVLNFNKILELFCGTELFIFHLDFIVCNQP